MMSPINRLVVVVGVCRLRAVGTQPVRAWIRHYQCVVSLVRLLLYYFLLLW